MGFEPMTSGLTHSLLYHHIYISLVVSGICYPFEVVFVGITNVLLTRIKGIFV